MKKKATKKIVKKKVTKKVVKEKYAYTIKDKNFGEFKVLNSANAWWLESIKVERLIEVFKLDGTIEEARFYAGITEIQWKYFVKLHPEFYTIKEIISQYPALKARKEVVEGIDDFDKGLKYLERKRKKEWSPRIEQEQIGPIKHEIEKKEKDKIDDILKDF